MNHKRLVTVQDISCFGKCSLTVALPIISAMGIECCIIPTAILSAHTAFSGFTWHDLTDDLPKVSDHWKQMNLHFDAIYTGYLGSERQIDLMCSFFSDFGRDALKIVDPVMGDNGKLYTGFTTDFSQKMADLCAEADIIVPNLTEAAFLLGEEYRGDQPYDREYIESVLHRLAALGCKTAILTGVCYDGIHQGAVAYNRESGEFAEYFRENIDVKFHGTGDVFSSTLAGALVQGRSLRDSLQIAVDFTVASIHATTADHEQHWYGVRFEDCLAMLTSPADQIQS